MTIKKYSSANIKLFGLETEFKLAHLPFIVEKDVLGCLALEGTSGSGKTTLAKRIGTLNELATGGKVKVFSADKARYEDFIGIPIPDEKTGLMRVFPMENSVSQMQTVVIDEANRANYENQEKWMSLIATREIDGIHTKCKYLYLAMNPVLGEGNDTYEGVMPLDKAMGERIYALITMNSFSKLPKAVRMEILKSSVNNQTVWTPTDEDIQLHVDFLKNARDLYEETKEEILDKVLDYIDSIQLELKKETKGVISVEARRAQFIVTNILGVHALNRANGSNSLEQSALEALSISFPNRLWEQPIPYESIRLSHDRYKNLLKMSSSERQKNLLDFEGLELALREIEEYGNRTPLPTKEQLSKVINQNLPDLKGSAVNHYVFSAGAVLGLTMKVDPVNKKQKVMKEQEFSRLVKILSEVENSSQFKTYQSVYESIDKNGTLPDNLVIPDYIAQDESSTNENFQQVVLSLFGLEYTPYVMGILEVTKSKPTTSAEFLAISDRLINTSRTFSKLSDKYISRQS